jgi:hypothetical protein
MAQRRRRDSIASLPAAAWSMTMKQCLKGSLPGSAMGSRQGSIPGALVVVFAASLLLSGCLANDPIHQQNMADLARLEACGWYPKAFDPYYPASLQEAEERSRRGECGTPQKQTE